ncbi:hypothetical protein BC937DRAFT_88560, partial [Endogone sp. FLAS-F59071]
VNYIVIKAFRRIFALGKYFHQLNTRVTIVPAGFMLESKTALTIANDYVNAALSKHSEQTGRSRQSRRLSLSDSAGTVAPIGFISHDIGFLSSEVGMYAVAAAVAHHMGATEQSELHLQSLRSLLPSCFTSQTPSNLLTGRAGYLYALKFVLANAGPAAAEIFTPESIAPIYEAIIEDGRRTACDLGLAHRTPLMWRSDNQAYLGVSRGAAGILTVLMMWPDGADIEKEVKATLDFVLEECKAEDGIWPEVVSGKDDSAGFFGGQAGIAVCAAKAYEVYQEPRYLNAAMSAAELVWKRGLALQKGIGTSGNAYPFLTLFRITGEAADFERALALGLACTESEHTANNKIGTMENSWSLGEGLAGSIWLTADLTYWQVEVFVGAFGLTDI